MLPNEHGAHADTLSCALPAGQARQNAAPSLFSARYPSGQPTHSVEPNAWECSQPSHKEHSGEDVLLVLRKDPGAQSTHEEKPSAFTPLCPAGHEPGATVPAGQKYPLSQSSREEGVVQ